MTAAMFIGMMTSRPKDSTKRGFLAGSAPDGDGQDGLARIKNVPGVVRIQVYNRGTMQLVATTRSASDGTWKIDYIDPTQVYVVIGFDDRGRVNAAIQDWVRPALLG